MNTKKSSGAGTKKRNWAFVLYPESAPSDWIDKLRETGLPCAISPLHDKDINADGEPKKAHHHIILVYSGPTSFNVVNNLCSSLCQPIPQPLESIKGYYRYLTHADNPEKAQYSQSDIKALNGFDYAEYVELTRTEVNTIKMRLQQMIREGDILEYADLCDMLLDSDMRTEYDIAINNTYFFTRYIDSRRNKAKAKAFENNADKE